MALSVFLAEATPSTQVGMATAEEIRQIFLRAAPQSRSFAWLGNAPRVTRQSTDTAAITRAVWIGAWPPDTTRTTPPMGGVAQPVADSLKREFDARGYLGGPWRVTFSPYNEAVHGPLSFWRGPNAAASNTRSRDQFPTVIGRLGEQDNPYGPTTAATRPVTGGDIVGGAVSQGSAAAQQAVRDIGQTAQQQAAAVGQTARQQTEAATRPVQETVSQVKTVAIIAGVILVPLAAAWALSSARGIVRDVRSNPRKRRRR